jgi:hypothetical protein
MEIGLMSLAGGGVSGPPERGSLGSAKVLQSRVFQGCRGIADSAAQGHPNRRSRTGNREAKSKLLRSIFRQPDVVICRACRKVKSSVVWSTLRVNQPSRRRLVQSSVPGGRDHHKLGFQIIRAKIAITAVKAGTPDTNQIRNKR